MLEGLRSVPAPGAGCVEILVEPGGVGRQVTLPCPQLQDSPCHKHPQADDRVRGERGEGIRGMGEWLCRRPSLGEACS